MKFTKTNKVSLFHTHRKYSRQIRRRNPFPRYRKDLSRCKSHRRKRGSHLDRAVPRCKAGVSLFFLCSSVCSCSPSLSSRRSVYRYRNTVPRDTWWPEDPNWCTESRHDSCHPLLPPIWTIRPHPCPCRSRFRSSLLSSLPVASHDSSLLKLSGSYRL